MASSDPIALEPGTLLAQYYLLRELGKGKMAEVHLAFDLSRNDLVAIKRLLPHHERVDTFRKRMVRESQILSEVRHPHLVGFRADHTSGTPCFLALEFLRGESMDRRVRSEGGSLFVAEAFRYLGEIASGLHFAHSKGIIHRDIRPENIMVDHGGTSKVFDFGIAYADDQLLKTSIGEVGLMGEFASPEQMLGQTMTPQSDLYSLGATIYYCLTGRKVIEAKSVEQLFGQLEAPAIPPIQHDSSIPNSLNSLLTRLIAKHPSHRFQSAKDLMEEIGRLYTTEDPAEKKALFGRPEDANLAWARRAFVQKDYDKIHGLASHMEGLPDRKKAVFLRLRAQSAKAQGDTNACLQFLHQAVEVQPNDINYSLDYALELISQKQIPTAQQVMGRGFRSKLDQDVAQGLLTLLEAWNQPHVIEARKIQPGSAPAAPAKEAPASEEEKDDDSGIFSRIGSFFRK